jgi:hypothetical protein
MAPGFMSRATPPAHDTRCAALLTRRLIDAFERRLNLQEAGFRPAAPELQPWRWRLELSRRRIEPLHPLFEPCFGRFELPFTKLQRALKRFDQTAELVGMALIPKNSQARLSFFATRAEQWLERAGEIGLSKASAGAVVAAVAAAAEARAAAVSAAEAAKAATARANLADENLTRLGAAAIRTIKAFAASQPDPSDESGVLIAASIDPPRRPGPKHRTQVERDNAVPRVITAVAAPDALGNVRLRWESVRGATMGAGAGMSYTIARRVNNGPRSLLAMVGGPGPGRTSSTYLDEAVPIGARSIVYTITPSQGGGVGRAANAYVQFGRNLGEGEARAAA